MHGSPTRLPRFAQRISGAPGKGRAGPAIIVCVYIRIDESGDFSYRDDGLLRVSVIVGVVIPDRSWPAVDRFVDEHKRVWGMPDELKAGGMTDEQLLALAAFIVAENLTVSAIATDSEVFTVAAQKEWRRLLTENFRAAADRSARAIEDEQVAARVRRTSVRMHQQRHVSSAGFLQYQVLMPWLLNQLMSAALFRYRSLPADKDAWVFDIVTDAHEGADPGKSGDLLRDTIEATLAGHPSFSLFVPPEWPPTHPFIVRNTDPEENVISIRQTLAKGINSSHSHEDPGLQLADYVAHVLYTLLRVPAEPGASAAWSALYPAITPTPDGWPIKVWAWAEGKLDDVHVDRYASLVLPPASAVGRA